jgi:GDP-L-fucose synthase
MYFGSSCVYPKDTAQPIKEASLLTGELEKTSEPYSIAKIAGIKMCEAYRKQYGFNAIVAIPATVYGPEGDINIETAHVLGALIAKFYNAVENGEKKVLVWGTGNPRREFLFIDDFVSASIFLMEQYEDHEMINIGCGKDISIKELAEVIAKITGFRGEIIFDETKPDGAMQKLLDNSRIKDMGWTPKVDLEEGIEKIYKWYKQGSLS